MAPLGMSNRFSIGPPRLSAGGQKGAGRRQTMASGASATSGRTSLSSRRTSEAPNDRRATTSDRRQSSYVRAPTKGSSDPRPLSDKRFMNNEIRAVMGYLTMHGYEHPVTVKVLTSPSTKDFMHILAFLYRKIDANVRLGDKIEEQVPQLFKMLKYPFNLSKSQLQSCGSQHTWPYLLGALSWIVELLEYQEVATAQLNDPESLAAQVDDPEKMFFQYLSTAYQDFLGGEDDFTVIDQSLCADFETKNAHIKEETTRIQNENAALEAQIEALQQKANRVPELTQQKADLTGDSDKFKDFIHKLEQRADALAKKIAGHKLEQKQTIAEVKRLEDTKEELKKIIQEQEMNAVDVEKINQEKAELETALKQSADHKERADKRVWELEMEISKRLVVVETTVQKYNEVGVRMQLIPKNAKYAKGIDYEIRLQSHAMDAAGMVGVDLKGEIRPALSSLKSAFVTKLYQFQENYIEIAEKLDTLTESVTDARQEVTKLQERLSVLDQDYKLEKNTLAEQLKQWTLDTNKIVTETHEILQASVDSVSQSQAYLEAKTIEAENLKKMHEREIEEVKQHILATLERLMDHKSAMQDSLVAVAGHFEKSRDEIVKGGTEQ